MKSNLLLKLICLLAAISLFLALTGVGVIGSQQQIQEPQLIVAADNEGASLSVEAKTPGGAMYRVLLRRTQARVQLGAKGSDPAGRAMFVDWSEGSERWFAYSRDGQTWSEPRRIETALQMRDGIIAADMVMPVVPPYLKMPDEGSLFLVQFRTLSLPEWRQALEEAGARILSYFPHNAHMVRIRAARAARLARLPFVQRIEPYHPFYRIDRELRDWVDQVERSGLADSGQFRVNVLAFEWGPDAKNRIAEQAMSFGARVASNPPSGQLLELWVDHNQLKRLAALDDVMWIDRWHPPENDMNLVREDSGANFLESTTGRCGQGVRGEVMDGGIEHTHQDFDGIILRTASDVSSHGTATYGIVFGNGARDGDGNSTATGHLPCAQGIFADNGTIGGDRFAHTQQLKQAPFFGSFQSNSWGSGLTTSYTSVSSQMDDIIWRLDIAICQSQSNDGTRNSRPQAWAKNIISVGGIRHRNTLSESDDAWAGGASIGPAADGRIKPDVNYWYDSIFTTTTGNTYAGFGGTSAATPEVAGVLGLMVQMWSENVWGTNPQGSTVFERQPHASTIKALLINNSKQYTFSGTSHDLTRVHQGWGRPSVQVAAQRADNSFIVDESNPLSLDETATYSLEVLPGENELKVTMVYPDPPGTTSASLHRINDLSLKVTSPAGTVYHGNNGLLSGNFSTPGGAPNTIDTVENVFINSPQPGTWSVEVRAAEINSDAHLGTSEPDAVFALVVTGARLAVTTAVFEDDFETDKGWTSNPNGTDTATTGRWERGNPESTESDGPKQLGATVSGVNDLVTGRLAGSSAGANDIDGGVTSIRSPSITLPSGGNLTLSFNYYLAHRNNSSNADFLRVRIVSGSNTTTIFQRLGAATDVDGAWTSASASLNAFAGQTIRILIEAADTGGASLVEAGIDDVRITR